MLVIFAAVGLVVVFVIAAVAIGRESHRLSAQSPRPVFDLDEAVTWVAEQLPFEVSAVLSHDDVDCILHWHLEHLRRVQAEVPGGDGTGLPPSPFSVVGEQEVVERLLAQASADGFDYTLGQVQAVLEAELAYLELIGAMGPAEPTNLSEHGGI
ncbi:hypothetical protein BH24ACT1_BH24ACT1_11610 [soil metagenome]